MMAIIIPLALLTSLNWDLNDSQGMRAFFIGYTIIMLLIMLTSVMCVQCDLPGSNKKGE